MFLDGKRFIQTNDLANLEGNKPGPRSSNQKKKKKMGNLYMCALFIFARDVGGYHDLSLSTLAGEREGERAHVTPPACLPAYLHLCAADV